jgi:hypothetical protein
MSCRIVLRMGPKPTWNSFTCHSSSCICRQVCMLSAVWWPANIYISQYNPIARLHTASLTICIYTFYTDRHMRSAGCRSDMVYLRVTCGRSDFDSRLYHQTRMDFVWHLTNECIIIKGRLFSSYGRGLGRALPFPWQGPAVWGLQIWMSPSCLIYLATIHSDIQATNKINKVRLDSFGVGERFDICSVKPQVHHTTS